VSATLQFLLVLLAINSTDPTTTGKGSDMGKGKGGKGGMMGKGTPEKKSPDEDKKSDADIKKDSGEFVLASRNAAL
jgi:hypothetical protein